VLCYENKTNKYVWLYVTLLQYKCCNPPTVFRLHFVAIFRDVLYEEYIARTSQPMHKYKILSIVLRKRILGFASCTLVQRYQGFGGKHCFRFQGSRKGRQPISLKYLSVSINNTASHYRRFHHEKHMYNTNIKFSMTSIRQHA